MGKSNKVDSVTAVRPQIRDMVAPGDIEDFEKSLPSSTAESATPSAEAPKRKRRSKEEMAAARGQAEPEVDPLMSDPRYSRIVGEMSGMGGKEILSIGFKASGKPLDTKEEQRFDDVFYVMGRKGGFNPAQSWIALIIYFFAIAAQCIIARTDIAEKLAELFRPVKVAPPEKKAMDKPAQQPEVSAA